MKAQFGQHIGIDYSGAKTATSRLPGLQVYAATNHHPRRISPPAARVRNWTRREIFNWLLQQAAGPRRFIAGIDHGFSLPISYFKRYQLDTWHGFLADFHQHWPTDANNISVDDIRRGARCARTRAGPATELRLTEQWTSSAKSVFQFDIQGSVAKSTHAGLPWLHHLIAEAKHAIHVWPFDGWQIPPDKSVIAETYPSILRRRFARQNRTIDQHDAYSTARWLSEMDERGFLNRYFDPPLTNRERRIADREGWLLGIL